MLVADASSSSAPLSVICASVPTLASVSVALPMSAWVETPEPAPKKLMANDSTSALTRLSAVDCTVRLAAFTCARAPTCAAVVAAIVASRSTPLTATRPASDSPNVVPSTERSASAETVTAPPVTRASAPMPAVVSSSIVETTRTTLIDTATPAATPVVLPKVDESDCARTDTAPLPALTLAPSPT